MDVGKAYLQQDSDVSSQFDEASSVASSRRSYTAGTQEQDDASSSSSPLASAKRSFTDYSDSEVSSSASSKRSRTTNESNLTTALTNNNDEEENSNDDDEGGGGGSEDEEGPIHFDWDDMAAKTHDHTLLQSLPYSEIDTLTGWATHLERPEQSLPTQHHNLLMSLPNDPLPPSLLDYLHHTASHLMLCEKSLRDLKESFDTSALVAVGMVLEEMLTATFLPLAQLHVQRCRRMEELTPRNEEAAFQDWTLPPEEALVKIIEDREFEFSATGVACLPTAAPPTRIAPPGTKSEESSNDDLMREWCKSRGLNMAFMENRAGGCPPPTEVYDLDYSNNVYPTIPVRRLQSWCQSRDFDADFVQKNADIFRLFLSDGRV